MWQVSVCRESVAPADEPTELRLSVGPDETLASILSRIVTALDLPEIVSGRATWVLESRHPLAVIAQQWPLAQCVVPADARAADVIDRSRSPELYLRYYGQFDPCTALERLKAGEQLPEPFT
jgi:hypothetical protein